MSSQDAAYKEILGGLVEALLILEHEHVSKNIWLTTSRRKKGTKKEH